MFDMNDLPMKPTTSQPVKAPAARTRSAMPSAKKPKAKPADPVKFKATQARYKATMRQERTAKRPVKPLPPLGSKQGEQPRDRFGRFARKTGAILWGAAKGTGKVIAGTARGIKKAHKTIKRVRAAGQRRSRLEQRERRIALAEREKKLGIRKKVRRRRRS